MFLQDPDPIPPLLAVNVQAQAITRVGGTRASKKGPGASISRTQKVHIVHLRFVLRLNDRQPAPVYCKFRPVHVLAVCQHLPRSELNSTLLAWDPSSGSHMVRVSHPRALQRLGLLRYPQP